MSRAVRSTGFLMVWLCLWARPSAAQSVSEVLRFLVTNQSIATGSVERDRAAAESASQAISHALLANLSTIPITTSSGAFVYRLNPLLGTVERTTRSFGPFFVERALTASPLGASVGLAFQHMRFTALDGRSLQDGSLITTANRFVDETAPFDTDRLTLAINVDLATLYGNAGLTDWLEVGVAVPIMTLRLDGTRVNTYRDQTFTQSSGSSTAVGLADVVLRSKFRLFEDEGMGLAAAMEARLPTGREQDLLGTGTSSARVSAIGSMEGARLSTHANLGFTLGGLSRELSYGAALAFSAHDRFTVTSELIGRRVSGLGHLETVSAVHPTLSNVETFRLASTSSDENLIVFAPGFKWNLLDTWLLVANVRVPLTNVGLTTRLTPFIGVDYTIER